MLQVHTLPSGKNKKKNRVGRGNASSGNYSGRGMKGQRSRSGGKGGLKLRGLKQSMMATPKKRGFSSPHAKPQTVNLKDLDRLFTDGETVTIAELFAKGAVRSNRKEVKILGNGVLEKKLNVTANFFSQKAVEAIEKAGGSVTRIPAKQPLKKPDRTKKEEK